MHITATILKLKFEADQINKKEYRDDVEKRMLDL